RARREAWSRQIGGLSTPSPGDTRRGVGRGVGGAPGHGRRSHSLATFWSVRPSYSAAVGLITVVLPALILAFRICASGRRTGGAVRGGSVKPSTAERGLLRPKWSRVS